VPCYDHYYYQWRIPPPLSNVGEPEKNIFLKNIRKALKMHQILSKPEPQPKIANISIDKI